jgi:hypothetical protein
MEGMKDFVEFIARHLVDHPDELTLEQEEKDNSIIVRIKVGEADVGKIIGKKGRTAQSLRTLLSAILEIAD